MHMYDNLSWLLEVHVSLPSSLPRKQGRHFIDHSNVLVEFQLACILQHVSMVWCKQRRAFQDQLALQATLEVMVS